MINYTNIQVSESSPTEPVSLIEAKAWLVVDHDDHDDLLTSMITGARQSIEAFLNLALVTKSVALDIEFTSDCQKSVTLPYTSGVSAVVVKSIDSTDTETTLVTGTDYFVRGNLLRLNGGRYKVTYTTVPGTIPEALKEAIKMEVANRYANRGENNSVSTGLSEEAIVKSFPFKMIWL